jgi:hypothetical protein
MYENELLSFGKKEYNSFVIYFSILFEVYLERMSLMAEYQNKQELIEEINKRAKLFIDEFKEVESSQKDIRLEGVDRTPAQMIAYQLGWMQLILYWEEQNRKGIEVQTPTPELKWNQLGALYEQFDEQYSKETLENLIRLFERNIEMVTEMVQDYTEEELFKEGGRQWATTTPSNWPIWKWIHINTVAPFKSFRTKIRKWKKLRG